MMSKKQKKCRIVGVDQETNGSLIRVKCVCVALAKDFHLQY